MKKILVLFGMVSVFAIAAFADGGVDQTAVQAIEASSAGQLIEITTQGYTDNNGTYAYFVAVYQADGTEVNVAVPTTIADGESNIAVANQLCDFSKEWTRNNLDIDCIAK